MSSMHSKFFIILLQEIITLYIPSIYRWCMKKVVEELKSSTTTPIIRIWNKVQQIRYNTISYLFIFNCILYIILQINYLKL